MFEVGQKCYTYKERLHDCSSQDMKKSRFDVTECTIVGKDCVCDSVIVSFKWVTRWKVEIVSHVKISSSRLFETAEEAKNELVRIEVEAKNKLPKVGDLVGFVESIPGENGEYVPEFLTSVVTKVNKESVQVMNTINSKDFSRTYHMNRMIILRRADPKKTKKQLREEKANV